MDDITAKIPYDGITTPAPATAIHAAEEFNDRRVELQSAVEDSDQTLDSADAGQLSKTMFANGVAAQSMVDSGAANTVVLTPVTGANGLRVATPITKTYALLDGAIFSFKANNTNSGNVTVNVGQDVGSLIGAESLFLEDGTTNIVSGVVVAGQTYSVKFTSVGGGKFLLLGISQYIKLHDSKPANTAGGTFTSGAWRKRTVTEDTDIGNNVVVTSSVIVLQAGTYRCFISCPAEGVNRHQTRLRNTTDGTTILVGTSEQADNGTPNGTRSFIVGRFTIAGSKNIEIQHQGLGTVADFGFGRAANFGENEIYTIAEFLKM